MLFSFVRVAYMKRAKFLLLFNFVPILLPNNCFENGLNLLCCFSLTNMFSKPEASLLNIEVGLNNLDKFYSSGYVDLLESIQIKKLTRFQPMSK
jgi:hypothetical protein